MTFFSEWDVSGRVMEQKLDIFFLLCFCDEKSMAYVAFSAWLLNKTHEAGTVVYPWTHA